MPKDGISACAGSAAGGIAKGTVTSESKAPWAYFDPEFNARNVWQKYRCADDAQYVFVFTFEPGTILLSGDGFGGTARGFSCLARHLSALPFYSQSWSSFLLPCSWRPERILESSGVTPHHAHPICVPFVRRLLNFYSDNSTAQHTGLQFVTCDMRAAFPNLFRAACVHKK
jgi:hypothetical protein